MSGAFRRKLSHESTEVKVSSGRHSKCKCLEVGMSLVSKRKTSSETEAQGVRESV